MRQQMVFSALSSAPVLVPTTKAKKKKLMENSVKPNPKDVARLRYTADTVRPHILKLALGIKFDVTFFNDLIRGLKTVPRILAGYFLLKEDGLLCLYRDETLLCKGSTEELFLYSVKYHSGAVSAVLSSARNGDYVSGGEYLDVELEALLDAHRSVRAAVPLLNRLTKIGQLPSIDYDHPIMKFSDVSPSDVSEGYYLMGSGKMGTTHWSLPEGGILVDTQALEGRTNRDTVDIHIRKNCNDVEICGKTVISDVSLGDSDGMTKGGCIRFYPEGSVLKLNIMDETGPRGSVIRKPRPHNFEVIYKVDASGKTWHENVLEWRRRIRDANVRRTHDVVHFKTNPNILPQCVTPAVLTRIKKRRVNYPGFTGSLRGPQSPAERFSQVFGKKVKNRHQAFKTTLASIDGVSDKDHFSVLPPDHIRKGSAALQDPNVGTPLFSAKSLLYSAKIHGWSLVRLHDDWLIC